MPIARARALPPWFECALRRCLLFSPQTSSALARSLLQTSPRLASAAIHSGGAIDDNNIREINGKRVNRIVGTRRRRLKYYVAGIKAIAPPTVAVSPSNRRALRRTCDRFALIKHLKRYRRVSHYNSLNLNTEIHRSEDSVDLGGLTLIPAYTRGL